MQVTKRIEMQKENTIHQDILDCIDEEVTNPIKETVGLLTRCESEISEVVDMVEKQISRINYLMLSTEKLYDETSTKKLSNKKESFIHEK